MKILLLGLGSIGSRHATNLRALRPDAQLVTVDPDPAKGADYRDWLQAIMENADADGAVVATPGRLHMAHMNVMAEKRIPFLVEKPPCVPEQTAKYSNLAGRIYMVLQVLPCAVGFQYRFHPALQGLAVDANIAFHAQEDLLARYGPDVLGVTGCHVVDLALYLLGPVREVELVQDGHQMLGRIMHESGLTSSYDIRIDRGPRQSWLTVGEKVIELDAAPEMYAAELESWLAWLEGGARDTRLATLRDGLAVMEVLERVEKL